MAVSKLEKKLLKQMGQAIAEYNMVQQGDRVMVCLSGGKDSYTLLNLMHLASVRTNHKFSVFAYTLDQGQPGWDGSQMRAWLEQQGYPYHIQQRDTYSIVLDKTREGKTYCSMCSRMRRGTIYGYAEAHGFNKIALGHHRDDLVRSLMMSICYSGEIRSMPPKMINDGGSAIVLRPLAYCAEEDIAEYAEQQRFPIIPCNLCGSQDNLTRQKVKQLIDEMAKENPKVPANMLNALGNIQISQLMDHRHWDFVNLEQKLRTGSLPASETECKSSESVMTPMENDILNY
jgi:tRNA 2-thiocytidine biosynthesis protein TtcA